ncbi:MAG: hypothetical protein A2Y94_11825 [Caldithrix sp. RBG_13_44_9]|nr:MAG: hypothetical protein A2Y94_11825 [Caldithrix sp. RBG_13_44_9]
MKNFKILGHLYLLVCILYSLVQAEGFNKGGRTAFQFVKIGIGARQVAMGEACMAVVRDVNSVFWNPANITGISKLQASFTYTQWLADMNYLAGVVGYRWRNIGVFALSVASLDYGDIPEALAFIPTGGNDTRTGESFTGNDMMLGLTFAREFTDRLSIGVSVKYLKEKLFVYDENVFVFEAGTYYDTGFKGIRIGMAAQNFAGRSVNWLEVSDREEGYDIPLLFKVGVAMDVFAGQDALFNFGEAHEFQLSFDAVNSNDYGERYLVGGEYWFHKLFALRCGYRFNYEEGNFAAGFGLQSRISGVGFQLDYAYVNYQYLDTPHRFSVLFSL